jgi:hypothetical protein
MKIFLMEKDGIIAAKYINPKNLPALKHKYGFRLFVDLKRDPPRDPPLEKGLMKKINIDHENDQDCRPVNKPTFIK